jgi:hypothetical protein
MVTEVVAVGEEEAAEGDVVAGEVAIRTGMIDGITVEIVILVAGVRMMTTVDVVGEMAGMVIETTVGGFMVAVAEVVGIALHLRSPHLRL